MLGYYFRCERRIFYELEGRYDFRRKRVMIILVDCFFELLEFWKLQVISGRPNLIAYLLRDKKEDNNFPNICII